MLLAIVVVLTCLTACFTGQLQHLLKQIASVSHEVDNEIEILVQPVQQQTNSTDCSVFALAFATAVCFGYIVSHCSFGMDKMRPHLWKCFHASIHLHFISFHT